MLLTIPQSGSSGDPNPLEQVVSVFARYVDVGSKPHYLVGMALWALHTHVYNRYNRSPRLAILSPVPNCGKSTVLDILGAMVWNPERLADPTVASTFRLAGNHTLLMDEVDNLSIVKSMKTILNDGHSIGGHVTRTGKDGEVLSYPVYGPVALAGIGKLPVGLMTRSLVIRLHRSPNQMERFNPREQYYSHLFHNWAEQVNLNPDPQMPSQLIGRDADKWRPLIAIADSLDRGDVAREVALEFIKETDTPDIKEFVLRDIQKVFDGIKKDKLTIDAVYDALWEDDEMDCEIDYGEQKITKRQIGNILADFQIKSRPHRFRNGGVKKCWFREDFEEMWIRYAR